MDGVYGEFFRTTQRETDKERKLKLPRYTKNLRYDAFGIYSYGTQIAELNMLDRTIRSLGKFSVTSSRHYNYARTFFREAYGFREI